MQGFQESVDSWQTDAPVYAHIGVTLPTVRAYMPEAFKRDFEGAMDAMEGMGFDALPTLITTPNAAVPAFLTTLVDPKVFRVLFAANKAAVIFGEARKGTWLDQTTLFPTIEHTGEVSTYGDYSENGKTGVNVQWPQRQAYLYQAIREYGDLELERAGLAKINYVSEIDVATATTCNKFQNFTYFFGVQGLQNYGLLNDPTLPASITPGAKANGGVKWFTAGGAINASANEIYADIQALFLQLVNQTAGLVEADAKLILALSPASAVALLTTNSFNVNVNDLLKKNFPNIRVETAVQYGTVTTANPQGQIAGNLLQLFVEDLEGQGTGYCAYNEKMYAQPIVRQLSSYRQKVVGGSWGAVIRQPLAIASMLGI